MKKIVGSAILLSVILNSLFLIPAFAAVPDVLRNAIEDKAKKLLEVNDQIQSAQKKLDATQTQKNSLQKELKKIDYSINQLNLNIRAGQIGVEKLTLELQELQYDIGETDADIDNRKSAIAKLIRLLHEKDREGLLFAFLRNKSLSDGLLEAQSIGNLSSGLASELKQLQTLNQKLNLQYQTTAEKKYGIVTENRNLQNRKVIVEDQKSERQTLLTQTKNKEKTFASLLDNLTKQQQAISAEIETIEKELRATIDPSLLPIPRPGVLALPTKGVLTQGYGETAFARYGYQGKFHNGIDIGAPIGTEIRSSESGTIVAVGDQDQYCRRGAYGKYIVIAHENNLTTLYAHLSRYVVQRGDKVEKGQLVGYVGYTGYATGPHLHFTVYAGPTFYMGASRVCGPMPLGGDLNPLNYLEQW